MIMPRPARRDVDLEGDLAAQTLALRHSGCCRCFCHLHPPSVVIARSNATKQSRVSRAALDCFAEPVIGRRFAPTRWLAMTVVCDAQRLKPAPSRHRWDN